MNARHSTSINGRTVASPDLRLGFVVARFNELIGERLLEGALDALARIGGDPDKAIIVRVPGAFEIPLAAQKLAASGTVRGIVCLGAVIRGATPHFDHVAGQAAAGIQKVALDTGLPIGFGVLTTDTLDQALERAGSKAGNKGADALLAVIEMIDCLARIDQLKPGN
ncbi:MAG: 6,7-dimethyl-8-ribityllumazine synthase [Planctomycetota bacterium]